jgi:hypothetical protein
MTHFYYDALLNVPIYQLKRQYRNDARAIDHAPNSRLSPSG